MVCFFSNFWYPLYVLNLSQHHDLRELSIHVCIYIYIFTETYHYLYDLDKMIINDVHICLHMYIYITLVICTLWRDFNLAKYLFHAGKRIRVGDSVLQDSPDVVAHFSVWGFSVPTLQSAIVGFYHVFQHSMSTWSCARHQHHQHSTPSRSELIESGLHMLALV